MEQYRQILENAARSELRVTVLYSVLLVAVSAAIWICWHFGSLKIKAKTESSRKKRANQSKILRQSTWAAVALTGICLVIGGVMWGSAVAVRRNIRCDLAQDTYETYTGVYYIEDYASVSKSRLYDRWTTVEFENGGVGYLYINSPLKWLQTEYGTFEGTVVYGRNSLIVVDLQGSILQLAGG